MNIPEILKEIHYEAHMSAERYGVFASSHEGYGVLAEEVAELLEAVRANDGCAIYAESIQVASVAARLAGATFDPAFKRRSNLHE